jgi:hypothetical protein
MAWLRKTGKHEKHSSLYDNRGKTIATFFRKFGTGVSKIFTTARRGKNDKYKICTCWKENLGKVIDLFQFRIVGTGVSRERTLRRVFPKRRVVERNGVYKDVPFGGITPGELLSFAYFSKIKHRSVQETYTAAHHKKEINKKNVPLAETTPGKIVHVFYFDCWGHGCPKYLYDSS